MRKTSLRLTLLSLAAAMVMSSLPSFTTAATVQLEPRRPVVRRPAARRAPRAVPAVPLGTNLRVRLNDDLSSKGPITFPGNHLKFSEIFCCKMTAAECSFKFLIVFL